MNYKIILICLILSLSESFASESKPGVVYGEDDRQDLFLLTNPRIKELSHSIAGMTLKRNLGKKQSSSIIDLLTVPYGIQHNLCKDEKFFDQPTLMNCSGFLIAPDLIATAGHCADEKFCAISAWIFDYSLKSESDPLNKMAENNIYYCKEIVVQEKDSLVDYGIIKLDRPVLDRAILKLNFNKNIQLSTPIFTLGYPLGLPLKFTDKGRIRSVEKDYNYFTTDLDSFGGSSGSPVFNGNTYEVEGILVRGEYDFAWDSERNCRAINRCSQDSCKGEDVTSVHFLKEQLENNSR